MRDILPDIFGVLVVMFCVIAFMATWAHENHITKTECEDQAGIYWGGECLSQMDAYKRLAERWPNYGGVK